MERTRYQLSYKYISFTAMLTRCALISVPVLGYGALITSVLYQFTDWQIYYLPAGLLISIFAYPWLFLKMRRRSLLYIDFYLILILIIGLSIDEGIQYIYLALGLGCGCGWTAVQGYIRETAGWEDRRAAYINNSPSVMFVIGIAFSLILGESVDNLSTRYLILFTGLLGLSVIRFVVLVVFNQETPVYHMRRFEELRGKLMLQRIYSQEFVDQIEYCHILNNEKLNDLNRSYMALCSRHYGLRYIAAVVLNLTTWTLVPTTFTLVFNKPILEELFIDQDSVTYFGFLAILLTILSGVIYHCIKIRMTLIASTSIILLINCITVVLFAIHDDDEAHKSAQIINLMELLDVIFFFLFQYPGLQLYTFQLLPDKGWGTTSNLQWVGLTVAVYLGNTTKDISSEEFLKVFLLFPVSATLQLIVLAAFGCEVQGLTEQQIQVEYGGKQKPQLLRE